MIKRRKELIQIAIVGFLGSMACLFGMNLILSDVANMFYMSLTKDVISSLPMFFIALQFVAFALGLVRYYARPRYKKATMKVYAILLLVFAIAGIATSVLTATMIYPSLLVPYPFTGAQVIFLVWHVVTFVICIVALKKISAMPNDIEKHKKTIWYVLYSIVLCLFIFYSFNRMGAALLMGTYVQISTLYLTFPLYIMLMLPMAELIVAMAFRFGVKASGAKGFLTYSIIVLVVGIATGIYMICFGLKNTAYVAAVSPAMPLERLIAIPIDTYLLVGVAIVFGILSVIKSLMFKKTGK